jgi:beta-lactam-binding protein with PASTA domain/tRNA A-37 threonylcarbamoyl transferase component Bud32
VSTAVPQQLGGRYEIGELLGRGGMAEVHIGRDSRLGRTVAVKMLRPDLARDPSFQARFRREAHSSASLNHPAVVAVYDTGEDEFAGNPVPYIVMEYVEGSTLRDLLASGNRLVPERALEIVDGVLAALAYSHQQGIVHRDIKPANVMLTAAGEVKVMDFGIARSLDDMSATMTQTSAVIGTAQYLSPEQARGEQVDARSDLYSTGCLLYELLTGRPPFVGDSPVSVAYQHVREEPVPPSQVDPDVSPSVDAIVLKALTKNRDDRYQTADEMRRDISAALAGRPVAAVLPPPTTATQQIQRTNVLPGTSTIPPVPGSHRGDRDGRGGRALGYALLGIAVLAVFVIVALLARSYLDGSGGAKVAVPDVTGLTVPDARSALEAEKLTLGTRTEKASDKIPEGSIIDQSPEAGTQVEEGGAVSVTVSTGADEAVVPSLVGLSLDEARQALNQAGLELGATDPVASDETRNTVVRVSPKEGETVPGGSKVDVKYASGNNKVPDVVGQDEETARNLIEQAGFTVATREEETADAPAGSVIRQTPAAKQATRLGSTVTITIAKAPPETPTPEPTDTPLPTDTITPPA